MAVVHRACTIAGLWLWCAVFAGVSQSQAPQDAKALEARFQTEYQSRVETPYKASVADLNTQYLASLDRALMLAQAKGALEEALALQKETASASKGDAMPPEDDATTPPSLKNLRSVHRKSLAKLDSDRTLRLRPVTEAYATRLNEVVVALTKSGKLDEAKEARAMLEKIRSAGPQADRPLRDFLVGTTWLWYNSPRNRMKFLEDGTVELEDWSRKGLMTGWKVTGRNTVELFILKGRTTSTTATLEFADDRTSFTGVDFNGSSKIQSSTRAQEETPAAP